MGKILHDYTISIKNDGFIPLEAKMALIQMFKNNDHVWVVSREEEDLENEIDFIAGNEK